MQKVLYEIQTKHKLPAGQVDVALPSALQSASVFGRRDADHEVIVLSREEALSAYKFRVWGEERLIVSDSRLYVKDERLVSTSEGQESWQVAVYPAPMHSVAPSIGVARQPAEGPFAVYSISVPRYEPMATIEKPSDKNALLQLDANWPDHVSDVFLNVEYDGDVAAAYIGNRMLTDHIHYGEAWPIGLKQYKDELETSTLHLSITPLRKGTVHTFVNQALVERFEGVEIAMFHSIRPIPYYTVVLAQSFE